MSEYQYYEFQAVDRPLSKVDMAELRAISTRATITPTRLQNVYHYGDFKGDPLALMERYFDAFVYVANWGTHQLMIRLPGRLLDPATVRPYAIEGFLDVHARRECVILELGREDDDGGGGWVEDDESESWMPALLPLRADLAAGDLRALYLAWLAGIRADMLDEDEVEPRVPAGLGTLSASLNALVEFLRVDEDLIAVAAERSPALAAGPAPGYLARWIGAMPVADKDALLIRLVAEDGAPIRAELLQGFRREHSSPSEAHPGSRTVAELLAAAEERAEARKRREAERKAAERARKEREQAATRETYLGELVGHEDHLWRRAGELIEAKRVKEYEQAVEVLKDLRDLGVRQGQGDGFAARLRSIRERYANRPALLQRLDNAGLRG